ncbi:AlpA family phage regulatory protein [Agrobacterium sp. BA1120]|uniref:helix-turn-helix transcriptional regulator n=1 Tax=Agrobacterium sp. BA1120 TaxID=3228927 RepID=UPI00336A9B5A
MSENAQPRLISAKDAATETTLSTVQLAAMAAAGLFPKPIQISERRFAYVRSEVTGWLDERIASRTAH